jgi:Tudor domain
MKPPRLPEVGEEEIPIMICHVEEPNHFWIQRSDSVAYSDMNQMATIIRSNLVKEDVYHLAIDHLVLAPYSFIGENGPETLHFRAKIIACERDAHEVKVYYIDFGNCADVKKSDLHKLPPPLLHFPPLAIECYWTAIGPSLVADPKGHWIPEAHEYVQQFVDAKLIAKVCCPSSITNVSDVSLLRFL